MENYRLLEEGFKYYGLKEVAGSRDNKLIVEMLQSVATWADSDEIACLAEFYDKNKCLSNKD